METRNGCLRSEPCKEYKVEIKIKLTCEEFITKYGRKIFSTVKHFIILAVSLKGGAIINADEKDYFLRDITWDKICENKNHPLTKELKQYLDIKRKKSKI